MIKQKLLLTLNVIFGLSIVFYIIYIRVIVVRLPKELYIYDEEYNLKLRLVFIIVVGFCFAVYKIVYSIMTLRGFQQNTNYITRVFSHISKIVFNALFDTYNLILNTIPNVYDKLSFINQKFYETFGNISEIFFILIDYFIRSLILIAFLFDVILWFQLDIFYKTLYLLIVTILIKLFFYMLKDFVSNLEMLKKDLIIIDKGIDNNTGLPRTSYRFRDITETADLHYHIEQYILCSKLSGYLQCYYDFSQYLQPYFFLILYSSYCLGWSYILYVNIVTYFL